MLKKNQINFRSIFVTNVLGGMAWGLGATVGLAVILAVLGFILNRLNLVPIVGSFISDILNPVLQNNPGLVK